MEVAGEAVPLTEVDGRTCFEEHFRPRNEPSPTSVSDVLTHTRDGPQQVPDTYSIAGFA